QTKIATGAVGLITSGLQAEEILQNERADLIFIGRALLRNPYWAKVAAVELGYKLVAIQLYERGWKLQSIWSLYDEIMCILQKINFRGNMCKRPIQTKKLIKCRTLITPRDK